MELKINAMWKYMAMDLDGRVYMFSGKPILNPGKDFWICPNQDVYAVRIDDLGLLELRSIKRIKNCTTLWKLQNGEWLLHET